MASLVIEIKLINIEIKAPDKIEQCYKNQHRSDVDEFQ